MSVVDRQETSQPARTASSPCTVLHETPLLSSTGAFSQNLKLVRWRVTQEVDCQNQKLQLTTDAFRQYPEIFCCLRKVIVVHFIKQATTGHRITKKLSVSTFKLSSATLRRRAIRNLSCQVKSGLATQLVNIRLPTDNSQVRQIVSKITSYLEGVNDTLERY